jgi:hypothetical protein
MGINCPIYQRNFVPGKPWRIVRYVATGALAERTLRLPFRSAA